MLSVTVVEILMDLRHRSADGLGQALLGSVFGGFHQPGYNRGVVEQGRQIIES